MKCVICHRETHMGEAYALPRLVRVGIGIANLYACSRVCRDQWHAAPAAPPETRQQTDTPDGPDAAPIETSQDPATPNKTDTPPDAAPSGMLPLFPLEELP